MRRILKPIKNTVVCKKINSSNERINIGGIFLNKKYVDLYQILDFSVDNKDDFPFKVGDVVISQATGDEIEVNENEIVYMFETKYIMCKVLD